MTGNQIRRKRNAKGWSQSRLARIALMHPSTISLIEAGRLRPSKNQVEKLRLALETVSNEDGVQRVRTN